MPDTTPCPYPPGTEEKIEWLAARYAAGQSLFHAEDAIWDQFNVDQQSGMAKPKVSEEKLARRDSGSTGVERMRRGGWRARPYWRGRRINLGIFAMERDAIRAVERFWLKTLGVFASVRHTSSWWYQEPPSKKKKKRRKIAHRDKRQCRTSPKLNETSHASGT